MNRRSFGRRLAGLFFFCLAAAPPASACGGEADPCAVPLGVYHAAVPDQPAAGKRPAIIFLHGAGGRGTMATDPAGYVEPFRKLGYVVIGPQGVMREGVAFGSGWSFRRESPPLRDEAAFLTQVLADAETRFGVDRARVILGGFSIGAAMVWRIACETPGFARAYAPNAGGFWRPHPETCAGPVDLFHTHGWADRVVPLEGRPLRGGAIFQGDIFEGLQLWRKINGCAGVRPDDTSTTGPYWLRRWTVCASGKGLTLALHTAGHEDAPPDWAATIHAWFEALK